MNPSTYCAVLFLAAAALYVARYYILRRQSDAHRLPGPVFSSWFWGNEKEAFDYGMMDMYTRWAATYGGLYKIRAALLHSDLLVASDHAAVQYVLLNVDTFVKAPQFREMVKRFVGNGLITTEHEEHKRLRRLVAPAFSAEVVKGMLTTMAECAEKMESKLALLAASNAGEVTVNITQHLSMCTLDIIGRVAFGYDFQGGESQEANSLRNTWNGQLGFSNTIFGLLGECTLRLFPFLASIPMPGIKESAVKLAIDRTTRNLLEFGGAEEKGRDMLSVLIRAYARDGSEDALSHQELVDNIALFMLAGHETSAGTLSFILLELARNSDVQRKLRDEVIDIGRGLTYDIIQKMSYLDAVVKEGMRLYPAARWAERMALSDTVLPLAKPVQASDGQLLSSVRIRAGQVIHIPYVTVNVNPEVWGSTASKFIPERWIASGGVPPPDQLPHGWSGILSFSDGPNNCIGFRVALLQVKVILATLIRTLEFEDSGADITVRHNPSVHARVDGTAALLPLKVSLAV